MKAGHEIQSLTFYVGLGMPSKTLPFSLTLFEQFLQNDESLIN